MRSTLGAHRRRGNPSRARWIAGGTRRLQLSRGIDAAETLETAGASDLELDLLQLSRGIDAAETSLHR
jgi:hypothetical protein